MTAGRGGVLGPAQLRALRAMAQSPDGVGMVSGLSAMGLSVRGLVVIEERGRGFADPYRCRITDAGRRLLDPPEFKRQA